MSSFSRCFNPDCEEFAPEIWKKGWKLRSGEFAELCERCSILFEEGRFCERFHLSASGWRCCHCCGKRVHCGCIVSARGFVMLDEGGIECLSCLNNSVMVSNTRLPFIQRSSQEHPVTNLSQVLIEPWKKESTLPGRLSFLSLERRKNEEICEGSKTVTSKSIVSEAHDNGSHDYSMSKTFLRDETSSSCFNWFLPYKHSTEHSMKRSCLQNVKPRPFEKKSHPSKADTCPNAVITLLFEKMLSTSATGRKGCLKLPKRYAEAYFPPIDHPEGLPLQIQDSLGEGWTFKFRFWPTNNSRMYVLEGITPFIQSMRLQPGDTLTFSRLEPEGKLVLGFRKTSCTPSPGQNLRAGQNTTPSVDLASIDKSGRTKAKLSLCRKRKNNTSGSSAVCLTELKLTWEEAQLLLRPPSDSFPQVVAIEGFEFEEYEEPPILGRPTLFAKDKSQWAQCEDCLKWRKIPCEAILPSRWTCSKNSWDPNRSICSEAPELTVEQFEHMLVSRKQDANAAQITTKHPRHRSGCSCIVCIQPPSGRGPKHNQACDCTICMSLKRRLQTLIPEREKKQVSVSRDRSDDGVNTHMEESTYCSFNARIDLNVQPEPCEETLESRNMVRIIQDASDRYLMEQRRMSSSSSDACVGSI